MKHGILAIFTRLLIFSCNISITDSLKSLKSIGWYLIVALFISLKSESRFCAKLLMWSAAKVGNISGIYKYRLPLVRVMCENYEGLKKTYYALVKKTWWQLMHANTRKSKNRRNMSKKINKIERRPKYGNQTTHLAWSILVFIELIYMIVFVSSLIFVRNNKNMRQIQQ